jgi:16S rRNA (cytosine967-C5)-methyltransferase
MGVKCVQTRVASPEADAGEPPVDRILVDAPCSNTGVMRRRVDLRWRVRPEEIERLRQAQLELLRQAAPRLKPGGVLVYSTCSLEPEENSAVVKEFLIANPQFTLAHERELTPFTDEVDGAYCATLMAVQSRSGETPLP